MSTETLEAIRRDRDQLLTLVRTLRPLLPLHIDAPNLNVRTALESLDAILARGELVKLLSTLFIQWDVVANRTGPASETGFPLRAGACVYGEALVASVTPFVLVSMDGLTVWKDLTPEQRDCLVIVRHAINGEEGPALLRLKADLFAGIDEPQS